LGKLWRRAGGIVLAFRKAGVDWRDLKREVWDSQKCFGCGACTSCPVKAIHFGDREMPAYYEPCVHCGVCYNVCPVTMTREKREELQEKLFEEPRGIVGSYRERYFARSTDFNIIKKSQDFGVVTTILRHILEEKIVDCVIVISSDENYRPFAVIARSFTDLQKSMKIKYLWYPVLRDLRKAVFDPTIESIAIIGVPCVIMGARRLEECVLKKYRRKIKFNLALFCWEILRQQLLPHLLFAHEKINAQSLYKIDVKKNMRVELKDGSEYEFDLADVKPFVRRGCHFCGDFTGEYADISVGKAGSPKNYNTVIVRTELGAKIFQQVREKKRIETVSLTGDDVFPLEKKLKIFGYAESLSERKFQRWSRREWPENQMKGSTSR
jgi:coenzyme F420 hydrogenase subunit beta